MCQRLWCLTFRAITPINLVGGSGVDLQNTEGSDSVNPNCRPLFTYDKRVLLRINLRIYHQFGANTQNQTEV